MKTFEFNVGGDKAIIYNPEFDKNFTEGIYKNDEGVYETAGTYRFQNGSNSFSKKGDLKNKLYFICRGRNIENGAKILTNILNETNEKDISIEQLKLDIKEKLPTVKIYNAYEDFKNSTYESDFNKIIESCTGTQEDQFLRHHHDPIKYSHEL